MKRILNIAFGLALILSSNFAYCNDDAVELTKNITKTFDATSGKVIASGNSFGNTTVIITPGSSVKYDIKIKVTAATKDKAQSQMDRIIIEFNDTPQKVTALTQIGSKNSGWLDWSWSGSNTNMEIDYTIYTPDNMSLALGQSYGNISVPDYKGPVSLDVSYGDINAGDFSNNSKIALDYGKGYLGKLYTTSINADYSDIELESASKADINMDYGNLKIKSNVSHLKINSDYTDVEIQTVSDLIAKADYCNYSINSAGKTTFQGDYGGMEITNLSGNLDLTADYHTTEIHTVLGSVDNIKLGGDYSNLKIASLQGDYQYSVSGDYVTCNCAGKSKSQDDDDSDKTYTGSRNARGGSNHTDINVKGDYINVSIK